MQAVGRVVEMVSLEGRSWRPWIAACLLWIGVGSPVVARAFSDPLSYFDEPSAGGGGGRWFTGSPAEGYGCSVCHTSVPGQLQYPFYVEGLPKAGYVAGATYNLRMSWPEFAVKAHQLRQVQGTPSMSVIAEFVAENGTSSGTLDIDTDNPSLGELCEFPANNTKPGMDLYSVVPGPSPAKATKKVTSCDANKLGTRCLLAVRSCGAQEVLATWTAPAQWQGPIWFAAGFVATETLSGTPDHDVVNEVAHPMMPATSGAAGYESFLEGGCNVSSKHLSAKGLWPLVLALGFVARSRRRAWMHRGGRRARFVTALISVLALLGCVSSEAQPIYPNLGDENVGLYTPGSKLGLVDSTKAGASDAGKDAAATVTSAAGDRCMGLVPNDNARLGTLIVDYTTAALQPTLKWAPTNIGAVWIETASGVYVKTIERWAAIRGESLYSWANHACVSSWPELDAVTRATLPNHSQSHHSVWSGKDFKGTVAPDGTYHLLLDFAENEGGDTIVMYEFEKGPTGQMTQEPDSPPFMGLKLNYMPPAADP